MVLVSLLILTGGVQLVEPLLWLLIVNLQKYCDLLKNILIADAYVTASSNRIGLLHSFRTIRTNTNRKINVIKIYSLSNKKIKKFVSLEK